MLLFWLFDPGGVGLLQGGGIFFGDFPGSEFHVWKLQKFRKRGTHASTTLRSSGRGFYTHNFF